MCIYIADSLHLQQKRTQHSFVKHLHSNKERKKDGEIVAVFNCREIWRLNSYIFYMQVCSCNHICKIHPLVSLLGDSIYIFVSNRRLS